MEKYQEERKCLYAHIPPKNINLDVNKFIFLKKVQWKRCMFPFNHYKKID
jgi:hypothetical protein